MNTSVNVIYSGTVSAATEGAVLGIPAIAVSLASHSLIADMHTAAAFARKISSEVLKRGLPKGTLLNVNVPDVPPDEIAGVSVTRQGRSSWDDGFETRRDPVGRDYYWLVGKYVWDTNPDVDDYALRKNMISVTPLHYNLTDEGLYNDMQEWNIGSLHRGKKT
jgi:5'-nucleotidase